MELLLKNKNFLFMFLGRMITNIGDSIYYVAAMWLVYDLGGSAFYSGLAGFLTMLPTALQFLVGPFVDKWQIKRTLVLTQILQCVLILIIPISYRFDFLTVQLILIVMPLVAFIEQFAYPAQTKALPLLLGKSELMKGNSLFSFAYQGIDLVFNAAAGILVAMVGAVTLYIVDSVTFAIAAISFSLVKLPLRNNKEYIQENKTNGRHAIKKYLIDLKEGFIIVFHSLLGSFLIGSVIANFAIGITFAILPSFADSRGGSEVYGLFLTGLSAGSLIGALLASWLGKFKTGYLSIISFAIAACCWTLAALIPFTTIAIILFGLAWVPIGGTNVIFGTISQMVIPNEVLGRVNSVSRSMSAIAMPFGSLLGGYLATVFNSQFLFALTGAGILFISIVWLFHPKLRALPQATELSAETFGLKFGEEYEKGSPYSDMIN
ncbi:MFS transporter [Peribacillus cavernae]|uniref:MFS transporter n=1 Tax=Peribacillus cavernae TaxID=1674310 RepID=A0A433HC71_9BACI|nr:MFS transporter [Peribacillus cavernae]MDQ0219587.1 MFS family permease [Peribacillus cavernae]RUQ25877.1 MFS transporter [Peribacillus cavernae]